MYMSTLVFKKSNIHPDFLKKTRRNINRILLLHVTCHLRILGFILTPPCLQNWGWTKLQVG